MTLNDPRALLCPCAQHPWERGPSAQHPRAPGGLSSPSDSPQTAQPRRPESTQRVSDVLTCTSRSAVSFPKSIPGP